MYCHFCGSLLGENANFCGNCGARKKSLSSLQTCDDKKEIITFYFKRGYEYQTICMFLEKYHQTTISLRTLKRRLAEYGLKKNPDSISDDCLRTIIEREIEGPTSLKGYRNIWNKLRVTYGITVSRDKVMEMLRVVDPEGSAFRKSRKLSKLLLEYYIILCIINCHIYEQTFLKQNLQPLLKFVVFIQSRYFAVV